MTFCEGLGINSRGPFLFSREIRGHHTQFTVPTPCHGDATKPQTIFGGASRPAATKLYKGAAAPSYHSPASRPGMRKLSPRSSRKTPPTEAGLKPGSREARSLLRQADGTIRARYSGAMPEKYPVPFGRGIARRTYRWRPKR